MPVSWTTLNPEQLVQQMKSFNFELDSFEDFMKTVCISTVMQNQNMVQKIRFDKFRP